MTSVEIRGLEELKRKLGSGLLDKPLRTLLTGAAIIVQSKARERAPVDTGRLTNSIAYEIDSSNPPEWAKVGPMGKDAGAVSKYGRILDESRRHHYRGGRAKGQASARAVAQGKGRGGRGITSRLGSKTHGWFSGTPGTVRSQLQALADNAANEIERAFGR